MQQATSEDISLATRWILERMERDQDERREWQDEWRNANYKSSSGISSLMMGWLVTRTVVELAILVALIWR